MGSWKTFGRSGKNMRVLEAVIKRGMNDSRRCKPPLEKKTSFLKRNHIIFKNTVLSTWARNQ